MKLIAAIGGLLLSIFVLVGAQTPELEFVAQAGGTCQAVDAAGDLVYMGQGPRLVVLDASDPASPIEIGRSALLPNRIVDLQVVDGYAYLASVSYGVRILSVEDPTNPVEVGWADAGDTAEGLFVVEDLLYVADRYQGLSIHSIADKTSPELLGRLPMEASAEAVAVSGDYAYVATRAGGLRVVSVADPAAPIEVRAVEDIDTAIGVALDGTHAYVVDQYFGIHILALDNPGVPVAVGALEVEQPTGIVLMDHLAYVTTAWSGVQVVLLEDPSAPEIVATVDLRGETFSPVITETLLYIANTARGLRILSIEDPKSPVVLGTFDESSFGWGIDVDGDLACLVDYTEGLHVLDVSNPEEVQPVAFLEFAEAEYVDVVGTMAYVSDWESFILVDLTDPMTPVETGRVVLGYRPQQMEVVGNYAYVVTMHNGLIVISVADPEEPTVVGSLPMDGLGVAIDVQDDFAYVGADGLHIISIADPENPEEVGVFDPGQRAYQVRADGDVVYYTEGSSLYVISVLDPTNPVELGRKAFGLATRMDFAGDYLAAGVGWKGVELVDVSDASAIQIATRFDTADRAVAIKAVDNDIYVADQHGGLFILRLITEEPEGDG